MTNEKAIKWLKVEASYIEEDVGHGKEILEAYDMAIKALEQTRWIPVSERLPESDDDVLVTDDAGGLASVGIDWLDIYSNRWCCSQNVTAWMPLPNPYRGGDTDAK